MANVQCRPLTDDEVTNVINALDSTRDRMLFILGVRTGFRVAELVSIRVQDVWQYGKPKETLTVTKAKMKGRKASRTVPLHDEAKIAIAAWVSESELGGGDYLFSSRKGSGPIKPNQARLILKAAYRQLELEGNLSSHTMRKTFAKTIYEESGFNIRLTQLACGHKSVDSTVRYLEVGQDKVWEHIRNAKKTKAG